MAIINSLEIFADNKAPPALTTAGAYWQDSIDHGSGFATKDVKIGSGQPLFVNFGVGATLGWAGSPTAFLELWGGTKVDGSGNINAGGSLLGTVAASGESGLVAGFRTSMVVIMSTQDRRRYWQLRWRGDAASASPTGTCSAFVSLDPWVRPINPAITGR